MPTTSTGRVDQRRAGPPAFEGAAIEENVVEMLQRRPAVGMAVGVVGNGRVEFFHGHGVADIASSTPVTEHTVFRVASITKTFTAIAVMQLWERGLLDLDGPANDYLRAYRLVPARPGFRQATVRHLLTHTAGIREVVRPSGAFRPDFGESVLAGQPLPSLADFYRGGLRFDAEPGTRFVYNNHGPATLGQLVEDVSGLSLDRYFRDHIFEPLGMADSDLVRSVRVQTRLATGYEIRSRGVKAITERDMVTAGAASVYSSPRDMARYLAALVGGGTNAHGSILSAETLAMMYEPHYRPDPRIPGMGLGFFRSELGGRHCFGHQGTHPGFHSQILVSPADGVGVMAFTNGARQAMLWLPAEMLRLLGHLVALPGEAIRRDVPQHPRLWSDLCGWYRLSARFTDVRLRGMIGAGAEVFVRGGRLMLRFLTPIPALVAGFPLWPDDASDPDVFRIDLSGSGLETMRVVFGRNPAGRAARLHLDLMPLTLDKRPAASNPRRWATGAITAIGATAAAAALRRRVEA
jgi:CubicO group peptidase (beta-lactamase class C family)